MTSRRPNVALSWTLGLVLGCSSSEVPPSSRLPAGLAARAGNELVSTASVARVAHQQRIAPKEALQRAVFDALFAEAARASLPRETSESIERAAVARSLLEQMARDATASGPPSSGEIAELVRERWVDLDRPDAARTTHAVVRFEGPQRESQARQVAMKLAQAVAGATSSKDFIALAQAVPSEGLQVTTEVLPAVTSDGRLFEERDAKFVALQGSFDLAFARAANALLQPGELSPIVRSAFGFHVIRLEARIAGAAFPAAELATLLEPEIVTRRAKRARAQLLETRRKAVEIQLDRGADELTARIKAAP